MVAVQAFNGAGDTATPTWINLVFFWLIQIPLSWWLALHLQWGSDGVFWGVFYSETGVGLFKLWLFSREIGSASCRERGCQHGLTWVVADPIKKHNIENKYKTYIF